MSAWGKSPAKHVEIMYSEDHNIIYADKYAILLILDCAAFSEMEEMDI